MADAVKEEMRVAFGQKMAQAKLGLEFSSVQSDGEFADILAVLDGWDDLSGAERKERSVSIFGESSKSKGYKLARKYHLVDVGGIVHVLTKDGGAGGVGTLEDAGWRRPGVVGSG